MLMGEMPQLDGRSWTIARTFFPAAAYDHPASGLVALRVVRQGSSYADIDLGLGPRRVFTRPGDLLFSLPESATHFRIEEGRELTFLQIAADHAKVLLSAAGGASLDELAPLQRAPVREPLVAELCRRLEEGRESSSSSYAGWSLGLILASLLDHARKLAAQRRRPVLTMLRFEAMLERIARDLALPLSVDALAETAGLSRGEFATSFREATGLPVYQYVLRQRADRAVEYLTSTDLPLAEIAARTGFAHQAHMSRTVRTMRGQTPGQIRNKQD